MGREDPAPTRRHCPPFPEAFPVCWLATAPPATRLCLADPAGLGCGGSPVEASPDPVLAGHADCDGESGQSTELGPGPAPAPSLQVLEGQGLRQGRRPWAGGRAGAEPAYRSWEHCGLRPGRSGSPWPFFLRALDKPAPERGPTWARPAASWCQWAGNVLPDPLGRPP